MNTFLSHSFNQNLSSYDKQKPKSGSESPGLYASFRRLIILFKRLLRQPNYCVSIIDFDSQQTVNGNSVKKFFSCLEAANELTATDLSQPPKIKSARDKAHRPLKCSIDSHLSELQKLKSQVLESFGLLLDSIRRQFQKVLENSQLEFTKKLDDIFKDERLRQIEADLIKKHRRFLANNSVKRKAKFLSTLCSVKYINDSARQLQQNLANSANAFIGRIKEQMSNIIFEELTASVKTELETAPGHLLAKLDQLKEGCHKLRRSSPESRASAPKPFSNDSCFILECEGQMQMYSFNRMIQNADNPQILLEYIALQTQIRGLTKAMCRFLCEQIFSGRTVLLNCIFDISKSSRRDDVQKIKTFGKESLFICRTREGRLFGGYYKVPFEPNNQKNVIFSLSKSTVHRFKPDCSQSRILANLTTESVRPRFESDGEIILRMGEQDLVLYKTKMHELAGRSRLGESYSNDARGKSHLAGKEQFTIEQLLIFLVDF